MVGVHMFVDEGLGHSSYLIDLGDGSAAVIDPPRFATDHLAAARRLGISPRWAIDTHSHADYITGSPALAHGDGITLVAPAASRLEGPHLGVADEERIELAKDVTLRAIATPGHTPDHHVYLIEQSGAPLALFSGGSLMVGAVGRTDLCGPDLAEPLAHAMFHSLRRMDGLPDDLAVYPTHGAGSFCSAPGGADRTTTLGRERSTNHLFRIDDEGTFVEELLAGFGTFPSYFRELPERNRRGPRLYNTVPELARVDVETVERVVATGGVVVDARPISDFAIGHVPGAISNALRPVFASWLGWVVGLDRPVLIVADDHQDRTEIVRQCLDIGQEALVGELDGGIDAWGATGRAIACTSLVGPDGIAGTLLDVRQRSEFEAGHVPDAVNVELAELSIADIRDGPITVMCGHGERAMTGASILANRGYRELRVFDGGPDTWSTSTGRPLVAR